MNKDEFDFSIKKIKMITYMPRKLQDHSEHLLFFLKKHLPKSWKIKSIHNLKQKDVYKYLLKSKIFLAFSKLEGLALPPIEAAIAGNKVIGYTGGGGIEYWKEPIFNKIDNGDISNFGRKLLYEIKNYKKSWINKTKKNRLKLERQYSAEIENKTLNLLINKVNKFYNIN